MGFLHLGIICQQQGVFSNMIEGVVSKLQAVQQGGKSRVCVLERSCRSTSITVCVHTCLCMWYAVCVHVCGCRCVRGVGVHLCVCAHMHMCVVCTSRSGMDWSCLKPEV